MWGSSAGCWLPRRRAATIVNRKAALCGRRAAGTGAGGIWDGCWDAVTGDAAKADESREPSRAQAAGSAATVRDVVQAHTGLLREAGAAQATAMSLMERARRWDGDKAAKLELELEHPGATATATATDGQVAASIEAQEGGLSGRL